MKKAVLIIMMLFLLCFSVYGQEVENEDKVIIKGIARQIMTNMVKYINETDFNRPYMHNYYKLIMNEMSLKIRKFNDEIIKKEKYKIAGVGIQIRGEVTGDKKPQWIFLHLVFTDSTEWLIKIRIKQNEKDI